MNKFTENTSTTLYNGLLTIREDGLIGICDEDFESSIAFLNTLMLDLVECFNESPEYFKRDILISVYHYFSTLEVAHADEIVGDIKGKINDRDISLNVDYALELIDDGYEWIVIEIDKQKDILAKNIENQLRVL